MSFLFAEGEPEALEARLASAADAMEAEGWSDAIGLLVGILADVEGRALHLVEATTRAMLAQALASTGPMEAALEQASLAIAAAENTDHRDVIHRCLALRESLRIIGQVG